MNEYLERYERDALPLLDRMVNNTLRVAPCFTLPQTSPLRDDHGRAGDWAKSRGIG